MGNEVTYKILNTLHAIENEGFLDKVFGKYKSIAVKGGMPVVLFGAGAAGRDILPLFKAFGVTPTCFCDNNFFDEEGEFCGLPKISFDTLNVDHKDSLIVIASVRFFEEIRGKLLAHGFSPDKVLTIEPKLLTFYADKNSIIDTILSSPSSVEEINFLDNFFGENKTKVLKGDIPVVLFGAGVVGKTLLPLLNFHGVYPVCYCDNRIEELAGVFNGLPVISFASLEKKRGNSLIILSLDDNPMQVNKQLIENGFTKQSIVAPSRELMFFYCQLSHAYYSARIFSGNR